MSPLAADPLESLRARSSAKWQVFPNDVLPLWVAEMDYPIAGPIAEALIARVRASDTGYVSGPILVADAFSDFADRSWGWGVDPAGVRTTTDVSVAIVETLRQVIAPGERVVITPPVYPPFFDLVPEAGGVVEEVPLLLSDSGWSLDLDGIESAFAAGAAALLLCNPHNPLGLVHSREQLQAVAEIAARYGAIVISDEIHGPLVHQARTFVPFLSVSDAAREFGVCVTSASKAFNIAGAKCALMVGAHPAMVELLDRMPEEVGFRTSILGLHAGAAAFELGSPWLAEALALIEANRDMLARLLAEHLPAVRYRMPEASYLAWLDFSELGWGDDPSVTALEIGRVALNAGPTFGRQGKGFARLNFACSPDMLEDAVLRLAAAAR